MSDENSEEKVFCVDRAKQGRAACKKCKNKCPVGDLRIAKISPSPFGVGKMKNWYHVHCIFEQMLKQRVTTKRIESPDDIDGWDNLNSEDQDELFKNIEENNKDFAGKHGKNYSPKKITNVVTTKPSIVADATTSALTKKNTVINKQHNEKESKYLYFREFRRLVTNISNVDSYTDKTNFVKELFSKGLDGTGFKGNITQWCKLLLPGVVKRIYNLQNKQLVKLFSKIFNADQKLMVDSLNRGDIGETIQQFFEESTSLKPAKKSTLLVQEVDNFLSELSQLTKEEDQLNQFQDITRKCTPNDLKVIIRLIKHDLRMNAGAKHILQGLHPDAYEAYQACRNLDTVVKRFICEPSSSSGTSLNAEISIMTPIQPMLAEACKSVKKAIQKCPNGIYSEIKYDGERVQVHKHGLEFKYFSRSLKPVLHHKIAHFEKYIPKAFPQATDLILDSEILMIDNETGKPLPFGTLGVHKKSEFQNANVCLFIFDCIYYNGESLVQKPLDYRKQILKENMTEIPNRIVFAEMEMIRTANELSSMVHKVLRLGLEGLVLKDIKSFYKPGKRHWLKIKKDYLHDGAIADTADLIVLGAWFGTGRKAGLMSVFLMGCYDENTKQFCTVTKVHTGHDDKTLGRLQRELEMDEIKCNYNKVPNWLNCNKPMTPDFIARNPKNQPVWEITGAEFTQHDVHTADGISIRFPRVTRIRSDKTWKTATTLQELKDLFKTSKETTDLKLPIDVTNETDAIVEHKIEASSHSVKKGKKREHGCEDVSPLPSKIPNTSGQSVKQNDIADDIFQKIKNPLPDIFKNVYLLLEDGTKEVFEKVLRHFVAFGGVVLDINDWKKATHVLHLDNSVTEQSITCPKQAQHIIHEWIQNSIANQKLQDTSPYTVCWEPEKYVTRKLDTKP